jgi:hypothetical protein
MSRGAAVDAGVPGAQGVPSGKGHGGGDVGDEGFAVFPAFGQVDGEISCAEVGEDEQCGSGCRVVAVRA